LAGSDPTDQALDDDAGTTMSLPAFRIDRTEVPTRVAGIRNEPLTAKA